MNAITALSKALIKCTLINEYYLGLNTSWTAIKTTLGLFLEIFVTSFHHPGQSLTGLEVLGKIIGPEFNL